MKINSGLFAVLLAIWMSGATYWYVCKIKKDCESKDTSVLTNTVNNNTETEKNTNTILNDNTNPTPQDSKISKKEIISKTKEKLTTGYIVFDFPKNSVEHNKISNDFNAFAENLKLYLIENNKDKVKIIGHTDNIGSEEANLIFGKKRAVFIKNKLVKMGIPEKHFIIKSEGENKPLKTNDTENGRKQNRRVIIKLSAK